MRPRSPLTFAAFAVLASLAALLTGCPDEKKDVAPAASASAAGSGDPAVKAAPPGNTGSGW